MTATLTVLQCGPGVTVQDQGRPGYLAYGLSRGGATDLLALAEGAALLGQSPELAAIEMAGMGGVFDVSEDVVIALTGALMKADCDGTALRWNASHMVPKGSRLTIGAAREGVYGYLHVAGGVDAANRLGARSAHLAAGIGKPVKAGDMLAIGSEAGSAQAGLKLDPDARLSGGMVRIVPSLQTASFASEELTRFEATGFKRDPRGNRMGVQMTPEGPGFESREGLSVLSEIIVPGDVQITGNGTPFVLMSECQTTGGYPRIGSVLACDMPKVAQAQPGTEIRFQFVSLEEGRDLVLRALREWAGLGKRCTPLVRDPHDIPDLLSYQLISGAIAGDET